MSFLSKLVVVAVASLSLGSVACVIGEKRVEVIEYDPHLATAGLVCSSPTVKVDVSKLTACHGGDGKGTGKGHCYPRMKSGMYEADDYLDDACKADEICVPDKILEADGAELEKCTFKAAGEPQEGRCLANLSKQMAANFTYLKSVDDPVCDDDEACSPCIHPIKKEDTHICQPVGVHEQDCTEGEKGKQVELCCAGLGICMPSKSVPGGAADDLPKDSCQHADTEVCAPAALIDGKAEKCDLAGVDGVCLPFCFADMVKGAQAGVRSSCNALSFCLPCAAAKLSGFDMPGCE